MLSYIDSLNHNHGLLFVIAIAILLALGYASYLTIFRHIAPQRRREPYIYLFTVMAFTTTVDLLLALTIDGWIGTMGFYLEQGERYLLSAHGTLCSRPSPIDIG